MLVWFPRLGSFCFESALFYLPVRCSLGQPGTSSQVLGLLGVSALPLSFVFTFLLEFVSPPMPHNLSLAQLLAEPHSLADSEVFLVVFCEVESIHSVWLVVWLRDVLLQLGGLTDKTLLESSATSFAYTPPFIFRLTACVCRSHCPRIPRSLPFFLLSVVLSLPDQLSCLSLYLPISR